MPSITIHGRTWDPEGLEDVPNADDPANSLHPKPAEDAANTRFIIIQIAGPLSEKQHSWLLQHDVYIQSRVDPVTFLCNYQHPDLIELRQQSFISYADVYHTYWKYPPDLDPSSLSSPHDDHEPVEIQSMPIIIELHANPARSIQQVLEELVSNKLVDPARTTIFTNRIETVVDIHNIQAIAAIDDVRAIDQAYDEQPHITVARDLLNCPIDAITLTDKGSEGALVTLNGEGEVINIVDSGFDKGDINDVHPAFTSTTTRCKALYTLAPRDNLPGSKAADDTDGHGTHVTGCAVANGESLTMGGIDANHKGRIRAPAYGAGFTVTQYLGNNGWILVRDLADFVDRPYNEHACRISNHSYGPNLVPTLKPTSYDARNRDVDAYLATHPDLVVTWAAGNSGEIQPAPGFGQICGRATSKNVITVGSTMSARHIDDSHYSPAAAEADTYAMSSTSSCGPTRELRIKPDVCAPGRVILSARSRNSTEKDSFGPSTDPSYKWDTGTSMAAPAVAGCAAVLRQALRQRQILVPTGALIKALLVNGAIDMMREPGQPPQIPNNTQGFGRVNLQGSLHMVLVGTSPDSTGCSTQLPHAGFFDVTDKHQIYKPIADGAKQSFPPLPVPDASPLLATLSHAESGNPPPPLPESPLVSRSLKVTLTWYDTPDALLQDRLGLAVNASNGERRHGNKGAMNMQAKPDDFDNVNNVQLVVWENVPPGQVTFEISCKTTLPGRSVMYALAWSLE